MEKLEPLCIADGNVKWYSHYGKQFESASKNYTSLSRGFPGGSDVKNLPGRRRLGFNPWIRKIPWRRAWHYFSVFLSGESPWTEEPAGYRPLACKESDTTEQLSTHTSHGPAIPCRGYTSEFNRAQTKLVQESSQQHYS